MLTLDPNLNRKAMEAIGRHLSEHRNSPAGAMNQVKEAAAQWLALGREPRYAGFLELKCYNSVPTLQGLVTDVFVLVEILPYGTDKRDRPALYIRLEDDKESYQTFAKAFKELWTASPELVIRESVDANTQYTQFATELRRYRDYELTAAGWFGALQIGLATVVWREPGWMLGILCANCLAQFVLAALIYILGFSGVFSVQYSKIRGRQLQQDVVNKRFPEALSGLPPAKVTPYHWIVIVLGVLPVVHVCLLAFLLHWPIYITLPSILVPLILMVGAPWAIGKFVGFIEKPNKAV